MSTLVSSPPSVSYDARSFRINGVPELLLSAGIHYFRVPRALWADRIAKAKRGGMNCIETYVAWNFHEPMPGQFDFSGDRDLEAFLTECEQQQMYVIVRPGPYICAEWDYGGFPAWLQTLPGVVFRTMNFPYLSAVDRYFDAVCPIIARHQWDRGGRVILVQVENEYANLRWTRGKDMPVDDDYQRYLRDGLRARGITVPLITCEGYCDGTVECVNAHNPGDKMPGFRETFPDKPLFSTEFWTGWYDAWGLPHHTRAASDLEYASLRCFAEGACGYNYYVYAGGTNFGYTPMYLQATSYDYDAPLSETGRPTDKWRACRRVAQFAQTFKNVLLTGTVKQAVRATDGLRAWETATRENGSIVWVDNPDREKTVSGAVFPYLPEVTLGPQQMLPYVHDWPIVPPDSRAGGKYLSAYAGLVKSDAPVLTAYLLPDPFPGARVYVWGEPEQTREVALFNPGDRGKGIDVTFADVPQVYLVGASQVVALPEALSGRVFLSDDEAVPVLIGPDDVRDQSVLSAMVELAPNRTHTVYALAASGALTEINVEAPALPSPPVLSPWQTVSEPDYTRSDFDDSDWFVIEDLERDGNLIVRNIVQDEAEHGSNPYGWYRAHIHVPDATDATLHFAGATDRLTLWVNGERIGSSAIPPEDRREVWTATFDIRLPEGNTVLTVLADNLGLIKGDWQIGQGQEREKKGLYGPVTLTPSGNCYLMDITTWRFRGRLEGERADWQRSFPGSSLSRNGPICWHRATFTLDAPLDSATPLKVRLNGMGKGVLWVNGHNLGRYWVTAREETSNYQVPSWLAEQNIRTEKGNFPQREYYVPEPWLNVGENEIVLVETEGGSFRPDKVRLVWDADAACVITLAL